MSTIRRKVREHVGDFPIFRLFRHEIVDAHERPLYDAFTFAMQDWVSIVPVTSDGKFVFVRQHRYGIDAPTLEVPGGIIDAGQSPGEAALRELREETGYGRGKLVSLGAAHPNPALQDNRHHMFLVQDAERVGDPEFDPGEFCEVTTLTREQIRTGMRDGEITHALVLLALARAFDIIDRKSPLDWSV